MKRPVAYFFSVVVRAMAAMMPFMEKKTNIDPAIRLIPPIFSPATTTSTTAATAATKAIANRPPNQLGQAKAD
ncbi:hypothetical protein ACIPMZ_18045 [Scandinavium goeteborgense]|uniref:hypothetical protein n=1 Tax=Scandinavium goeteborgense TaxID=1851514 RepID=UPI00381C8506